MRALILRFCYRVKLASNYSYTILGLLSSDDKTHFKRILHRMWFALYPRAQRVKGSCAFEHVFLGEVKRGEVKGFHNWLFFLQEERQGKLDYYGFNKAFGFGKNSAGNRNGGIIKSVFEWENSIKPVSLTLVYTVNKYSDYFDSKVY